MKKNCKTLLLAALFVIAGMGMAGCKQNVEENLYWKSEEISGKPNTVTIDISRDIDFLAWTKENGEFISLPIPKGKKFPDTLKFAKGVRTFTFAEPGTYILNIYQKPDSDSNFNKEDLDFRGKVIVGEKAIKITDTGYAEKCPKQGIFNITNDSKQYEGASGNNMTELTYVVYKERIWDPERKKNYGIYETKYVHKGINVEAGKSIFLLFPMGEEGDTRYGGLILRPVVCNGETKYFGQTTNLSNRYTTHGFMSGKNNGSFYPIGNGQFECVW